MFCYKPTRLFNTRVQPNIDKVRRFGCDQTVSLHLNREKLLLSLLSAVVKCVAFSLADVCPEDVYLRREKNF